MSLPGSYQDHYKDMFMDTLLHQKQQDGSRLEQIVNSEFMAGNRTYIDIVGSVASSVKAARNEARVFSNQTYERRQVQETASEYATQFDREDLVKHASNPKSALIKAALRSLGRQKDLIIMEAVSGNAVVTTNGSTANQALTLSVAVNDHSYDSGSGDVGLTSGKLKKAMTLMLEAYGSTGTERLICVAPIRQIMNLSTEAEQVSGDYRDHKPLEGPGIVRKLSGFMGIDFIAYEETGVDGSADKKAFLLTEDAIALGIFIPLHVEVDKNKGNKLSPDYIAVWEATGAVRKFEESVVEILCDPLA